MFKRCADKLADWFIRKYVIPAVEPHIRIIFSQESAKVISRAQKAAQFDNARLFLEAHHKAVTGRGLYD